MSDQITLLEITDIGKKGIGFKFHGLKHFNDKWFSWAAISKAILHREDEIIIDQKCTMPNYKQLQSQVEQLMAELAAINSEKESKLQWNDKAQAQWQSWPPGATIVMPLPQAAGKVTIVKEKFYHADKELIEQLQAEKNALTDTLLATKAAKDVIVNQLQADNSRLREAIEDALPTLKSEEKRSSLITRTLQEAIASTDSSNWLQEQKAQWRREVLEEAAVISMQVYGGLPTEEELKER